MKPAVRYANHAVASMTQDDAHVFCTPEQIESEVVMLCELIRTFTPNLGLNHPP